MKSHSSHQSLGASWGWRKGCRGHQLHSPRGGILGSNAGSWAFGNDNSRGKSLGLVAGLKGKQGKGETPFKKLPTVTKNARIAGVIGTPLLSVLGKVIQIHGELNRHAERTADEKDLRELLL